MKSIILKTRITAFALIVLIFSCKKEIPPKPPTISTQDVTEILTYSAKSGGNIDDDGGAAITARGVCWSTNHNPTIGDSHTSDESGSGTFTSNLTGLSASTVYYVRAYATNKAGTSYGSQVSFTTYPILVPGEVFNPITGRIWMDRNLGAAQVATSSTDANSYGYIYQWGRGTDGHQIRTSGTISTLSSTDTPGHDKFITLSIGDNDWRNPQNAALWQGVSGINNPCPVGYRLPTEAEWEAERKSWSSNNSEGAFNSPLKLPVSGSRAHNNGSLANESFWGTYWSSTAPTTGSRLMFFGVDNAGIASSARAAGYSVRCIKD